MIAHRSISTIVAAALALALPQAHIAEADPATPFGKTYNIVFIGDSITHGAGTAQPATQAAPVVCGKLLEKQIPGSSVFVCNQGHVGYTSGGIAKGMAGIEKAVAPFTAAHSGQLVFSIMLGTNDSANSGPGGAPASAPDYRKNMKAIVDKILAAHPGAKIFIQHPIWYSANTHNTGADYEGEGPNRLKRYSAEIPGLVAEYATSHPNQVFEGDRKAYDDLAAHYQNDFAPQSGVHGTFYLHPNATGAAGLAKFWADAIAPNLAK